MNDETTAEITARSLFSGRDLHDDGLLAFLAPHGAIYRFSVLHHDHHGQQQLFSQNNLVSDDQPGHLNAQLQDPDLINPWGVAFGPNSPFWVNNNGTGTSTLYSVNPTTDTTTQVPLVVTIAPPAGSTAPSTPTGIVFNTDTSGFMVNGSPAAFIFDTEDGTISAWNPAVNMTNADIAVNNSNVGTGGAVYKGLAFGVTTTGAHLYAANFRAGTVDVFDASFTPNLVDGEVPDSTTATNITGSFADPEIPAGFAPFGIQNINGDLYVSYAKQDAAKHDPVNAPHAGVVDIFSTEGVLLNRFTAGGPLNSPWGLVQAPPSFGRFGNDILVGNFGDGTINVFGPHGEFFGPMLGANGLPLINGGLWALVFGGGSKSSPDTLYFSAGPNSETNGVFGTIVPTAAEFDER
jgi:uncharacterized protein (TIGR03118 family)